MGQVKAGFSNGILSTRVTRCARFRRPLPHNRHRYRLHYINTCLSSCGSLEKKKKITRGRGKSPSYVFYAGFVALSWTWLSSLLAGRVDVGWACPCCYILPLSRPSIPSPVNYVVLLHPSRKWVGHCVGWFVVVSQRERVSRSAHGGHD